MTHVPFDFTILADSGVQEGGEVNAPTAQVKFKVAWADRVDFVKYVCGTTVGGPGSITRTIPLYYPPNPNLYATRQHLIEPLGKLRSDPEIDGWVCYDWAVVTINFAVPQYSYDFSPGGGSSTDDASGVPWTTTTLDVSGEFLTLPESTYKFAGGIVVGAPVGKVIPQVGISFKRHWLPYLPVAITFRLVGKLNDAPFNLGDFVAPIETLMFLGAPNVRQNDTAGNVSQEVEYKMVYRPISWNKFLHPDGTSGWQYIVDGGGNKVYELDDFSILP